MGTFDTENRECSRKLQFPNFSHSCTSIRIFCHINATYSIVYLMRLCKWEEYYSF